LFNIAKTAPPKKVVAPKPSKSSNKKAAEADTSAADVSAASVASSSSSSAKAAKPAAAVAPKLLQQQVYSENIKRVRERTNKGKIDLHFNKAAEPSSASKPKGISIQQVQGIAATSDSNFLYMYDKLQIKSETLMDRFVNLAEQLMEKHGIDGSQPIGVVSGVRKHTFVYFV